MKSSTILHIICLPNDEQLYSYFKTYTFQEVHRGLQYQAPKPYSFLELTKHSYSIAEIGLLFVPVFGRGRLAASTMRKL